MSDLFDLKRLYRLLILDIRPNVKSLLIFAATILLFIIIFHGKPDLENYFIVLYIGGITLTIRIFNNIHNPQQASIYLMLPCSNLERFLSKWLCTSIGYALGTLIIFYLIAVLKKFLYFFSDVKSLDLLDYSLWRGIGIYIILQSVVMLGAAFFKKNALLKIIFSLGCIFALLSFFTAFIGWAMFYPYHIVQGASMLEMSFQGLNLVFWIILAPTCWYLTYLRITEYELK